MGIGAALAPIFGGAAGLGTASFLPAAMSAAPKLMGLFGGGQTGGTGAPPMPMQNPFEGIVNPQQTAPPPPTPNPAFHDMGLFGEKPGAVNPAAPAKVSKTLRPMLASDMFGPGSSHSKTPMDSDAVLIADERKMSPESFMAAEEAAGVGPTTSVLEKSPYSGSSAQPVQAKTEAIEPFDGGPAAQAAPAAPKPPMPVQAAQQASGTDKGLFGDAFSSIKGFAGDLSEKLAESQTNPLFQTGMGLLAAGHDSRINPYTAINQNLGGIQPAMIAQQNADIRQQKADAQVAESEREKKLAEALAMIGMQYKPSGVGEEPRSQQTKGRATVIRR